MKLKQLISKLQKIEKTESGGVIFKIALPNWEEGSGLEDLKIVLCENTEGNEFTEIIFERSSFGNYPKFYGLPTV